MNTFQILFRQSGVRERASRIESAVSAFRVSSLDIPEATNSGGIMQDQFVEQIRRVATLIRQYQTMTHKDCEDVRRTTSALSAVDEILGNLFR